MKFFFVIFTLLFSSTFLFSCQTVTTKIDEQTIKEEKRLSKLLKKSESDLKLAYGKPDKIEFTDSRNRVYVYITEKLKIKCERKFEINPNNIIIGFTSKNCF
ncbi:MAG: hypothetical protein ACJZ69_00205 [Pelagibacteraceae bacterium]